jgi:cation transport ATPase
VQDAQQSKPAIQKLADSIMQYFIPTVLVIATIA